MQDTFGCYISLYDMLSGGWILDERINAYAICDGEASMQGGGEEDAGDVVCAEQDQTEGT